SATSSRMELVPQSIAAALVTWPSLAVTPHPPSRATPATPAPGSRRFFQPVRNTLASRDVVLSPLGPVMNRTPHGVRLATSKSLTMSRYVVSPLLPLHDHPRYPTA